MLPQSIFESLNSIKDQSIKITNDSMKKFVCLSKVPVLLTGDHVASEIKID